MLGLLEVPLTPSKPQLGGQSFEGIKGKYISRQTPESRTSVCPLGAAATSPASSCPNLRIAVKDRQALGSAAEHGLRSSGPSESSSRVTTRAASVSSPSFLFDDSQNGGVKKVAQNGAATSRSANVEASAKGKWRNVNDSSLSEEDEPLPLPMTWPGSKPATKEQVEEMLRCDPEVKLCRDVIYQWTGDCPKCQGTGLVSFYRKKHEVISKCMNCLGIGSVHKITSRGSIESMDDSEGSSNGSANGSTRTNGKP